MEPLNSSERKINKTAFGISAGLGLLLVAVLLISLFTRKQKEQERQSPLVVMQPVSVPKSSPGEESIFGTDVLQKRLIALQQLQQSYNNGIATGKDKDAIQHIKTAITIAEEAFKGSIDSIWIAAIANKNTDSFQLKTIAAYRNSLDSVRSANNLSAVASDKDFVPDRDAFIKMQDELMQKTNKIALLESNIQLMSRQAAKGQNNVADEPEKNHESETENAALLESKVNELTTGNQRLQQEIERLRKQPLTEAAKNNSSEQILLTKNTALQQKVNAINAELQLVRVDCNLSRVDATQIISNSKQRKQLLSEASSILTDLSASSDADIRNKVKEKIVRLNQVAANTRD